MNTISIDHGSEYEQFYLTENNKRVLKFRYNKQAHTARIQTVIGRRLIIIEEEGLIKTRITLKNEYGVGIGALHYNNFSDHSGSIEIENFGFRFLLKGKENSSMELQIFKQHTNDVYYSCLIHSDGNLLTSQTGQQLHKTQNASYIIAVSWYLYLKSVSKETLVESI